MPSGDSVLLIIAMPVIPIPAGIGRYFFVHRNLWEVNQNEGYVFAIGGDEEEKGF
jgi:hypothetical protein